HCHNDHASPLMAATLAGVPARIWSALAMSSNYETGNADGGKHAWAPSTWMSCLLAHRVLARSEAVRAELIAQGARAEQIVVSPPGIDLARFRMQLSGEARAEL